MKPVHAPHLGRPVMLGGRRRPVAHGPRLRLARYLQASMPAPPPACDYGAKASDVLSRVYLNDQLGDCVIAGGYHVVGVETANAGAAFVATDPQLVHDYSAIGGYRPGDPSTDNGCQLVDALNYWTAHGYQNGTKLLGWLAVDPTNRAELEAALYLFENLFLGMELPDAWINPFPSGPGFTWDVAGAPVPENGHCVMASRYDTRGVGIDTWALPGLLTWAALAQYGAPAAGGEVYVKLTPDQLAKGAAKAPNGFAWNDLLADFNAMGGHVPMPAPPAPPAPPKPAGPTLPQVQAWAAAGIAQHWPK